jgi:hypothetical protein
MFLFFQKMPNLTCLFFYKNCQAVHMKDIFLYSASVLCEVGRMFVIIDGNSTKYR